jgi:hypothetical protein
LTASVDQASALRETNEATARAMNEIWLANACANEGIQYLHRGLQDIPTPRSKIALVCGSGKSLDLHVDLILRNRKKLDLIAVDMAYPALLKHGIEPDLVVTMDPNESLKRCFEQMPDQRSGSLIAATVSHPAVLASWKGTIYFYNLFDPGAPALGQVAEMFPNIAPVDSKFNVGELSVCLASMYFGHEQVGFTGLDLAYWENQYYASGVPTVFTPNQSELTILWNNKNQPTLTTRKFVVYMQAFMKNYEMSYSRVSSLYNLSRGIIALNYRLAEFASLLDA